MIFIRYLNYSCIGGIRGILVINAFEGPSLRSLIIGWPQKLNITGDVPVNIANKEAQLNTSFMGMSNC